VASTPKKSGLAGRLASDFGVTKSGGSRRTTGRYARNSRRKPTDPVLPANITQAFKSPEFNYSRTFVDEKACLKSFRTCP
jgi:hypothetical protein